MPNLNSSTPAPPSGYQNVLFQYDESSPTNISACVPSFTWTVNGVSPGLTVQINGTAASQDQILLFNSQAGSGPITFS